MRQRVTGNMNNNESGFTLIEIMIALVVFSIGILSIGSLQLSSIIVNSRANRMTSAGTLASSRVELIKQIDLNSIGAVTLKQQGRYWFKREVNDDTPLVGVSKTVTIRVYSDAAGNDEVLRYSFIKTRDI